MSGAGGPSRRGVVRLTVGVMLVCFASARDAAGDPAQALFPTPERAFTHLYTVAKHPRCVNCHGTYRPDGLRIPTTGEAVMPHPMYVTERLNPRTGELHRAVKCRTCHGLENWRDVGGPPGAGNARSEWRMPTRPHTTLELDMSKQVLCVRWSKAIRDLFKETEGCSSPKPCSVSAFFVDHIDHDPLVAWAFGPGPGRQSAPGDLERLKAAARTWAPTLEDATWCQTIKEE